MVLEIINAWTVKWLLVFDNFDKPEAFEQKPIKDYFPRGGNGCILLTSRHEGSQSLGKTISTSEMLEDEALELLF